MTRSKKNKKRKSQALKDNSHSQEKSDALIEEAEAAVDSFNYDEAESKLQEVLRIDPNNTRSLEMLSAVFIEKFRWEDAQDLLKQCIEIKPDTGYSKYFSIGQLSEGLESVKYYEKGIQIIEKELEDGENIEPSKESKKGSILRSLSDAYCSIAETFMTDCCDEEHAEEKCRTAIDLSIKSDPSNSEAYRCLASFQLVKGEIEDAKESIQMSLSKWLPQFEAQRDEETEPDAEKELENVVPGYDSRIETSKLLIELEMYYEASNILEGLLEEDDEVVQVWYLLGWLNYMREGDEYKGNAHFYMRKAKQVSVKLGVEDECVDHINELLEELSKTHPISDEELCIENEQEDDCSSSIGSDFSTESDYEMET